MKLSSLLFLGLLFSTGILNAQTDFRPGYIIKNSGDTLYGEIDYRGDLLMSKICKFKSPDNTINDYLPNDIKAFRFIDSKYYVSREINSEKIFIEFLLKGKVNIYYTHDENGKHYYLDKEYAELIEIPYDEEIIYHENKPVLYKSKKHIGILNYYMQDAPGFQPKIQSIGKPEHNNLIKLAEDYHNIVCEGEKCIIYEKDNPFIKILPEIVGGIINYSDVDGLNDIFYAHTGIIGHMWLPRSNEKLYFRTGLLFSQLDIDNEKSSFYKIPLQFEYIYPKGIFRPRIAYGLNYYLLRYQTVSFNLGANIKLNDKLFLSASSDIEFNSTMLILPNDMLSYSIQLGLFMMLN